MDAGSAPTPGASGRESPFAEPERSLQAKANGSDVFLNDSIGSETRQKVRLSSDPVAILGRSGRDSI